METYVKKIGDVIIKRVTSDQGDDGSTVANASVLQPPPGEPPPPPPLPPTPSPPPHHEYMEQMSLSNDVNSELNHQVNSNEVNGAEEPSMPPPQPPPHNSNDQLELEESITHDDSEDDVDIDDDEDDDVDVLRGLKQGDSEVAQVMEPEDLLREVKTEPCDESLVDNEATIDETEDDNMDPEIDNSEDRVRSEGQEDDDMYKRKDHDDGDDDGQPNKKKKSDESGDSEKDKKKSVAINFRKNIREVMDENQLDEATLAAQRQEMERLRRVQDQQKYMREAQRQMQQISRQTIKSQSRGMSLFSGNSGASLSKNGQAAGTPQLPGTVVMKLGSGGPPQVLNKKVLEAIRSSSSRCSTPTPLEATSSGSPNSWPSQGLSSRILNKPHMVTPSVSIAPVKHGSGAPEKKDVVTISSSSDEDETESREKKHAVSSVGVSTATQQDASTLEGGDSVASRVGVGVGVGTGDDDDERPLEGGQTQEDDEDDCIVISEPSDEEDEEDVDPQNSGMHTNDMFNCPDEQGRVLINVGKPENEPDIFLPPQIARVIKPHQIGGVRFLFDNVVESLERFNNSTGFGCILAHSMGLGKTLQVVSFCDVFLRNTPAKTVMCIMPINTLQNWMAEFNLWLPVDPMSSPLASQGEVRPRNFQIFLMNDLHKTIASRAKVVQEWSNTGGVLLIGYEMYRQLSLKRPGRVRKGRKRIQEEEVDDVKNKPLLERMHEALVKPGPDLVICDEGHRIKNSHASISHALKQIRTKRRIVLTGYPLQNNLLEYWCMVDFVRPNYLGTKTEFSNMFERPIQNGQCIDSTPQDIRLMRYRAHVLHSLLEGFVQRRSHAVLRNSLPQKEEYVMLVRMSSLQRKLYDKFMNEVVRTKAVPNPLKAFAVCCKIWNHPDILYHFIKKRELDELQDLDLEEAASLNNAAGQPHNRPLDSNGPRGRGPKEKKGKGVKKAQAVAVPIKPATVAAVPPIEVKKEPQYGGWNPDGVGRNEGFHQQPHNYYGGMPYQNDYAAQQAPQQQQQQQQQQSQDGAYNYPGGQKTDASYGDYYQGGSYNFYPGGVKKEEEQQVFKTEPQKQTFSQMRSLSGGEVVYNRPACDVKKEFAYDDVNMQWRPSDQQQQSQQSDASAAAQQQCFPPQYDSQKGMNPSYESQQHFSQPPPPPPPPSNAAQQHFSSTEQKPVVNEQEYHSLDNYNNASNQQQQMFNQYQSNNFSTGQLQPVENTAKVETQGYQQQSAYSNVSQSNGAAYEQFQNQPPSSHFPPTQQQQQPPPSYPSSDQTQPFQSNFNQPQPSFPQNDSSGQSSTYPQQQPQQQQPPNTFGGLNPIQNAEPLGPLDQSQQQSFGASPQKQDQWSNGPSFNQTPSQHQPTSDSHSFQGYQQSNDSNQKNCSFQQIDYDAPQYHKNQNYEQQQPQPQSQPQYSQLGQFSQQDRDFGLQNQATSQNYGSQPQQTSASGNSSQTSYQTELQELTSGAYNSQSTTASFNQSSFQQSFSQPTAQNNFNQSSPQQSFTPQAQPQQNFSQTQSTFNQTAPQTGFNQNQSQSNFNQSPPQSSFSQNQAQSGFGQPQNFDQSQAQPNFNQSQSQQNFTQVPQQNFGQTQTSQQNFNQTQAPQQNFSQPQSQQLNYSQSQPSSHNFNQSQTSFPAPEQTSGASQFQPSHNYDQQPPPSQQPLYQNCSYPRDAPSGQSSSSWPDYFDSASASSSSASSTAQQSSSSSYSGGYTQSQSTTQSAPSNASSNTQQPYYSSPNPPQQGASNTQQPPQSQQQFPNQINPPGGNYYNKPSHSYYQNYEGNYQMSGSSGAGPPPPSLPNSCPKPTFKEKRGMSCQTEFEGDETCRKDVGVDQMSKDDDKEKKSESVGTSCMPSLKSGKEEMGIPYDWATELLKGYIPGDINASAKMAIFFCILEESIALGDRILVFSQSLFTLNLMEELLQQQRVPGKEEKWARNVNYYRLDGSTTAIEREKLINEFNSNPKLHLFLVSTRAGSLGINLVGANRVIVFDASWNPCHDTQAVCRVYRYGQKKPCFVYRLVTDHCLEKKIYDRQINKQGMSDRVVDECNPEAHLSIKEVTSLCWDDKIEDDSPKDYTSIQDNYIDVVIQKVLQRHSGLLSKEPFQHESLLVDRKEKKLSSAEKRLAKRSYELEKQASTSGNTRPVYPINMINPQTGLPRTGPHKPMASVRPMQSEMGNQMGRDNRPRGWIPASVWQRQGMSAQEMTLPLDVVIPTNSPDRASIVLKAGQKVMVLKSPKGIYMQLENGKIIAIRTNFKMGGKEKGSGGGSETTPPPSTQQSPQTQQQPTPPTPSNPQQNKKPGHQQQHTPQQQHMQHSLQPHNQHHQPNHHQEGPSPPQQQHHNQRMSQHQLHEHHHHHHPSIPSNLRNSPAVSITPRAGDPRPSPPMPFSQGNRPVRAVGPTNRPLTSSVTLTKKRVDSAGTATSPYENHMVPQTVALPPHNVAGGSGQMGHHGSSIHHKPSRVAAAHPPPMSPAMQPYGARGYGASSPMMQSYSREVSITPYSSSSPMNDSSMLHQQSRMHHQSYGKDVMQPSPVQMPMHRQHHQHSAGRYNPPPPPTPPHHHMQLPPPSPHGSTAHPQSPSSSQFRVPPSFPSKEVSITPFSSKQSSSSSRPPHSPSSGASTSHSPGRSPYMTPASSDMMDMSKMGGATKERSGKEKIGFQPYNSSGPTSSSSSGGSSGGVSGSSTTGRSELHHHHHHHHATPPSSATSHHSPLPPPPPQPLSGPQPLSHSTAAAAGYELPGGPAFPPSSPYLPPPPNPFTVAAASSTAAAGANPFYPPPPPQFLPPPPPSPHHMAPFPGHFPASTHR